MRAPLLALLAFAFPAHALASNPVPYAQCAPYTVKALQEGRVHDTAALFATPGKAPGNSQAEIAEQLTTMLGKVGSLSGINPITGMLPISTFKLEARDPDAGKDATKTSQVTHSAQTTKQGQVFLNVNYHHGRADCELFTVNIHVPMPDSMMLITFDTSDEKAYDTVVALLAEKKLAFTLATTESASKKIAQWKIETAPIPAATISAVGELYNSVMKTAGNLPGRLAFSSTYGGKPHTKP